MTTANAFYIANHPDLQEAYIAAQNALADLIKAIGAHNFYVWYQSRFPFGPTDTHSWQEVEQIARAKLYTVTPENDCNCNGVTQPCRFCREAAIANQS